MDIASIITNVLSGGVTGLAGAGIQLYAQYKTKQLDMQLEKQRGELELAKRDKDLLIVKAENEGKFKIAEKEGETAKAVAETEAFGKTLFHEPERYSSTQVTKNQMWWLVLLDVLRGVTRPLLTIYLCALTTYIWWQVRQLLTTEDLDGQDVLEIWKLVVNTILYLTTTVVLWWFGVRNKQPQPKLASLSSNLPRPDSASSRP